MGLRFINGLIFSIILLFASIAQAANYYVSTTGNDGNDGSAVDDAHAWLTSQKAADTAVAGDIVFFKAGTYAGFKSSTNSGTEGNPITFKKYQNDEVIIHREPSAGSDASILPIGTTWTNVSGNRWRSPTNSVPTNGAGGGLLRNHDLWFAFSNFSGNITGHGNDPWYWYDSTNDRVEINSTTDPSLDEFVVVDVNSKSIWLDGVDYIVIDGLILEYSRDGLYVNNSSDHNIYRNCVFRYNGRRGGSIRALPSIPTTDHLIENNVFHTNGEHGFKQTNDLSSSADGSNTYYHLRNNISYNNAYIGYQISNGGKYITVENNIAYDNGINPCGVNATGSEGCAGFGANFNNGLADNVIWKGNIGYSTGTKTYYGNDNPSLIRPGFSFFSTNNTIFENNYMHDNNGPGILGTQATAAGSNNVIRNNILVNNNTYDVYLTALDNTNFYNNTIGGGNSGSIYIGATALLNNFKNNLIFADSGVNILTFTSGSTSTLDYNAWYSPDVTPFSYAGTSYNFTNYKAASSQDANSINTDFTSDFINYSGGNYAIKSTASVRDAGAVLSDVLSDKRGVRRPKGAGYSIGAYEEGNSITFNGLTYD